jgi:REP element-mobilizing transposase RayT
MTHPHQAAFRFMNRGGKRKGAGRKPKVAGRPGVSHHGRPTLSKHHPVHVTMHVAQDVPNLRRNALHGPIMDTLRAAMYRPGFRLCHFAVLGNHLHLIVEADSKTDLARGLQGLASRLAKRVNAALGRRGRFFADRYHAHVLRTPAEVRNALAYVLLNHRRHEAERSAHVPLPAVDGFSSGAWFTGWTHEPRNADAIRRTRPPPIVPAHTWLLREGWRQRGSIAIR